jgi:hypothetical protein
VLQARRYFSTNTIGTDSMLVRSLLDEDNWGQTS